MLVIQECTDHSILSSHTAYSRPVNQQISFPIAIKMAAFFDCYEHLPSTEAKKEYFLDTKDLAHLPYESEYGGFGCGRATKWFKMDLLERVAEAKHGAAGLAKKRAQRKKRQEKQRQKELAAAHKASILITTEQSNPPNPCTPSPTTTKTTATATTSAVKTTTAADLKQLRKDIIQAFKPVITWDYLNSKRAPNGCSVTVRVPRVSMADYAALIGRPTDTSLETVVKKGAYFSVTDLDCCTILGSNAGIRGKGGRYGCNQQLGLDTSIPLTVKYKPSDGSVSVTGWVSHYDTFGF